MHPCRTAHASGSSGAPGFPGAFAFLSRASDRPRARGVDAGVHGPAGAAPADRAADDAPADAPLRVFLVEDNALIRENLAAALEELAPVTVIGHAAGCRDAVSALQAPGCDCDLAIVDVFLEQGSGIGVLSALRRGPRPARCVVLTNCATPAIREQCLTMGADAVFDKSSEIDALVDYCTGIAGGD